ncbi:MAG: endolytic transglycosylase MltG [Candidatus Zixiibacteriota bacterium]|nr:MAG: endolytic transglycosylase MltG [candidate division Zixibacteria bacterium]
MRVSFRIIRITLGIFLLVAVVLLARKVHQSVYGPNAQRAAGEYVELSITPGMPLPLVARQLEEKGAVNRARDFVFAARLLRLDHRIQAGEYVLPFGLSNADLLRRLIRAGANASLVTIPEGYNTREIAALLEEKVGMDSAAFMQAVYDSALLARLGIEAPSFEGFLFPESYSLHRGMEPAWVIQKMVQLFFQAFDSTDRARTDSLGLSLTEAVTLASIIEGEMLDPEEAGLISAVYHNRLKKKMLLQADPTIQYVVGDKPRRLVRSDLAVESPYNTYRYPGLPPGPVCNPGKLSLQAALHPAPAPYIFMVSQGNGRHAFTTNLDDHLQAKVKLDSVRRVLEEARAQAALEDSTRTDTTQTKE